MLNDIHNYRSTTRLHNEENITACDEAKVFENQDDNY